ncbi:MAG: IS66 family insertion sequence element accessory protein TnpB [Clostridia bacterium]|nr:IS66 family insertion sequence element accessory protein TnpB [Clostridia bacterium]
MLKDLAIKEDVYIVCGYTDMRRSIDGLAAMIKGTFGMDPFAPSLFLFCGKRRDRLKALYWEGDGFVLLYKRLENGSFKWPRTPEQARRLSHQEFRWLMDGLEVDQPKAIRNSKPKDIY